MNRKYCARKGYYAEWEGVKIVEVGQDTRQMFQRRYLKERQADRKRTTSDGCAAV